MKRLSENTRLNQEIERIRSERETILTNSNNLNDGIEKLNEDFGNGTDFGGSPEKMRKLFDKFEKNVEKSFLVLDNVNDDFNKVMAERIEFEDSLIIDDLPQELAIPVNLEQEDKDRKTSSTMKLNEVFLKLKKQHNQMLHSFAHDVDQDIHAENPMDSESALVPILQRKCNQLKKEVEVAESKARSISAQM